MGFETKCKKRAVVGIEPPHESQHVPAESLIYNAARPIYGQVQWTGDFVSGVFYTAVDPKNSLAQEWDELNRQQDATVLVYFTEAEAFEAAKAYYLETYSREEWDGLESLFSPAELREGLQNQFIDLIRDGDIAI